jgi:hypothetical protein
MKWRHFLNRMRIDLLLLRVPKLLEEVEGLDLVLETIVEIEKETVVTVVKEPS